MTVLFLTINNLQAWMGEQDIRFSFYYLRYLKAPWNIFLAPMFYMFLIHYLRISTFKKRLVFYSMVLFFLSLSTRSYLAYYLKPYIESSYFEMALRKYNSYEDIVIFVFTIAIFIYSAFIFFKKKNTFTLITKYDNLRWIRTFFVLSTIVLSFWLIALILNYFITSIHTSYFYTPLRLGTSFLIYWIGYQGLYQQKIVLNRIAIRDNLEKQLFEEESTSSLAHSLRKEQNIDKQLNNYNEVNTFILGKKRFLDPNLSLESLAGELGMSTSSLSQLINNYGKNSFTDYINKYRVELAKDLLTKKEYQNYTILSIGLEAGFNSKSTFYTAFKKFTGSTPVTYKRQVLDQKYIRNSPN